MIRISSSSSSSGAQAHKYCRNPGRFIGDLLRRFDRGVLLPLRDREMAPNAIGVIGAGISAACCVRALHASGLRAVVYEQGRGPGGRCATRTSRTAPFVCNHGCPAFTARAPEFVRLMAELQGEGAAERMDNVRLGTMNASTLIANRVSVPGLELWRGRGTQTALSEHIFERASSVMRYGTQVAGLDWDGEHWELRGRDGELLGKHRYLVVSTSGLAHPRWRSIFGTEPPLFRVRDRWGTVHGGLLSAVAAIGEVESRPVVTVFAGLEAAEAGEVDARFTSDLLHVEGHPIVRKIVTHRGAWGTSVAVHATHDFASRYRNVHGHKSAVSKYVAPPRDANAEELLRNQVWGAFSELVRREDGAVLDAAWGPFLHRWGSAFSDATVALQDTFVPGMNLAFCGDFTEPVASDSCHVEVAALSGMSAAERIIDASARPRV